MGAESAGFPKPLALLVEAPGPDGRSRMFLEVGSGTKLGLPYPYDPAELTLPGNSLELGGGKVFALYDPTTLTGLLLYDAPPLPRFWQQVQPIARDKFFGVDAPAALGMIESMAGTGS